MSNLSFKDLIIDNQFVPILRQESITQYVVKKANFASLIEFRSKMGFKFKSIEYQDNKVDLGHYSFENDIQG